MSVEIELIQDEYLPELEKYREHSVLLNRFCWQVAQALGEVHAGQGSSMVNIPELMERAVKKLSVAPTINVRVEYRPLDVDGIGDVEYLSVVRQEIEDDGSITAIVKGW